MSTLAAPLSLWDVRDVEALVRKVVDDRLRFWGASLRESDYDDLISYQIGVCWELSCRYDPAKDKKPNFGAYAARILTLRCADWFRQRFGDSRHGEKQIVLSLDAPASLSDWEGEGAQGGRDRLVDALSGSAGDPADDRSPDLVGVLQRGSSSDGRTDDTVGEPPNGGPESGTRAAKQEQRPARLVKPRVPPMLAAPKLDAPVCVHCTSVFLRAFIRANNPLPAAERKTKDELRDRARLRATAVKIGGKNGEWACPRCTTVPMPDGTRVAIHQLLPNRRARRDHGYGRGLTK